jgi:hypothetical protein
LNGDEHQRCEGKSARGNAPGHATKRFKSRNGAKLINPRRNVHHIRFRVFPGEDELILVCLLSVMFLLILDVSRNRWNARFAHRKTTIAGLPLKCREFFSFRLDPFRTSFLYQLNDRRDRPNAG